MEAIDMRMARRTGERNQIQSFIEWGVAACTFAGMDESGDQYLVEEFQNGVLVAVIDGLGHGPAAAIAGRAAIAALKGHAHASVASLFNRCHGRLKRTRGAVMSMASFDVLGGTMTWLGIGNVKGLLLDVNERAEPVCERLLLRGGIVGYQLPTLRPAVMPVSQGAVLVFATDGLRSGFVEGIVLDGSPQQIADRLLAQYGRGTDDAMVLVARYVGLDRSQVSEISKSGGRNGYK